MYYNYYSYCSHYSHYSHCSHYSHHNYYSHCNYCSHCTYSSYNSYNNQGLNRVIVVITRYTAISLYLGIALFKFYLVILHIRGESDHTKWVGG